MAGRRSIGLQELIGRIVGFINHDIWQVDYLAAGKRSRRYIRAIGITVKGYSEDKIGQQAKSLTYLCFISLVPLIAFIAVIASTLGVSQTILDFFYRNFEDLEQAVTTVVDCAQKIITTGRNGLFGLIGAGIFMWSVFWLIFSIEKSFNQVWDVRENRQLSHKIVYFLIVLLCIPLLVVLVILFSVTTSSLFDRLPVAPYFIEKFRPVFGWIGFSAFMLLLFFLGYKYIPNTKVTGSSAFSSAFIACFVFILMQVLYVEAQISFSRLNTVYGAFAAIPLFIIWLNITWNIVLTGAELTYAFDNIDTYEYDFAVDQANAYQRKLVALMVTRVVAKRFDMMQNPVSSETLALELSLPARIVNHSITTLIDTGILRSVISEDTDEPSYCPAIPTSMLTIAYVTSAVDKYGGEGLTNIIDNNKSIKLVRETLDNAALLFEKAPYNRLLTEI